MTGTGYEPVVRRNSLNGGKVLETVVLDIVYVQQPLQDSVGVLTQK